jgi:hypothetical protein
MRPPTRDSSQALLDAADKDRYFGEEATPELWAETKEKVLGSVKKKFPPELINRVRSSRRRHPPTIRAPRRPAIVRCHRLTSRCGSCCLVTVGWQPLIARRSLGVHAHRA